MNFHYENMAGRLESLRIPADALHYDDGVAELDQEPVFDWRTIYGRLAKADARAKGEPR